MSSPAASPITGLLLRWSGGDPLMEGVAHHHMRMEREGHTVQTTALVNEGHEAGDAG